MVSATRTGPDSVLCQVKPGFSFIRTTLKMTFTLVEKRPDQHVTIRVDATGIGTAFSVETKMDLVPHGTGTQMAWTATIVKMSGLVSAVGTTIIRAAGDQVIKDGFAALRKAMAK
jgi:carbon monoxide dehydrogenase subunit G